MTSDSKTLRNPNRPRKSVLPDQFDTQIVGRAIFISAYGSGYDWATNVQDGFLMGADLKDLAHRMLDGERVDRDDRAAAGAALLHLLALEKPNNLDPKKQKKKKP